MSLSDVNRIYFIGVGGIGMSALVRYFYSKGYNVAGYDRVKTELCVELENSGILIHYKDDVKLIPETFKDFSKKEQTQIICTPAISSENKELEWFKENGFSIHKRAEILGKITENYTTIAVAGTHGKTTISSCIAHLYQTSGIGCNAFLGGITKNYNTNILQSESSKIAVVEADEFDRSFLQLTPQAAIITAVDADHLDIYQNITKVTEAFSDFANRIVSGGKLLIKKETGFIPLQTKANIFTYSINEEADCKISDVVILDGKFSFNLITPWGNINNLTPGITGRFNIENCVAAASMCLWSGLDADTIRKGLATFMGVKRRFDVQVSKPGHVYIDDYAHHPEELKAFISSVKEVYSGKKITGIFQPHLYSRTRDFAEAFGKSLSLLDELILLDIYPAREEPIPGITSNTILQNITINNKILCSKEKMLNIVEIQKPEVLLTMGAGDIDQCVEPIKKLVNSF
jgi:UDP-N-acetylmuramate--alanine ligase